MIDLHDGFGSHQAMLDAARTKQNYIDWARSPAFDAQFNSVSKRAVWPFIAGGVLIITLIGLLPGIILVIYGIRREMVRKAARRDIHLAFENHQAILCRVVMANSKIYEEKNFIAPALLIGSFGPQDESAIKDACDAADLLFSLYGEDPSEVPVEHQEACRMVNDDVYQPNRRRALPSHLSPNRQLWLFDEVLSGELFESGIPDSELVPCLATPGPEGVISQLPWNFAVFHEEEYKPNIIRHKTPESPPPLVAPVAENLDAITDHITRHLGEPATVFHEMLSTTVHIDVHIVSATPERPWISLITSGMSDIPMNAPEQAAEFRFAELMIRLPADWPVDQESWKNEAHYWPVRCLKRLARFPHEYETWLCHSHSIPNGNPPEPFAPGSPFTGVVLSTPWNLNPEFSTLYLHNGTPVHFWSIIPVHTSEMDFRLAHGTEALLRKIAEAGHTDIFDPTRPPVV